MLGPVACVGPGRLGPALARRWREAGLSIHGFLGRERAAVERAVTFCGAGQPLASYADLRGAAVVLLSVGDTDLAKVARAAADAAAVGAGSLWLHCSGVHGLDVLAPLLSQSARVASMHPLCPVPNREIGHRILAGKAALIEAAPEDRSTMAELAERAGLLPIQIDRPIDRALYHAACSMAANGLSSLYDLLAAVFAEACGLAPKEIDSMLSGLMLGSLEACNEVGPTAALSGPVVRGDRAVLGQHLSALGDRALAEVYRPLMLHALEIARRGGQIDAERAAELSEILGRDARGGADG